MPKRSGLFSLSDLLFGFIQLTREKWPNATFPIWYSRLWHQFFYALKRELGPEFPELEQAIGFFEWDAPDPMNPELRELLGKAHAFGKLWTNEHYRIYPTRKLEHNLPSSLFEAMLKIAKEHEGLLVNVN